MYISLAMRSTWLNVGGIISKTFKQFFKPVFPVEHSIFHILGMVVQLMRNKTEMMQRDATLTRVPLILTFDLDIWPESFKVKLYLGNGKPDCHGTKGAGVDRMPWCETLRQWVKWMLRWLGYLWPWPLTLNFQGQILSRERNGRESIG